LLPQPILRLTAASRFSRFLRCLPTLPHGRPAAHGFTHHDWELVCAKTRTCRAAACSEEEVEPSATVLFNLAAGPGQAVKTQLKPLHHDEPAQPSPAVLQMQFGERELGTVSLDRKSAIAELSALGCTNCPAPRCSAQRQRDHVNRWRGAWTISVKGANAVLLKMDEFQGRLGTPGPLVGIGNKAKRLPLPPASDTGNRRSKRSELGRQPASSLIPAKTKLAGRTAHSVADEDSDNLARHR
jgi:hypothetical protein